MNRTCVGVFIIVAWSRTRDTRTATLFAGLVLPYTAVVSTELVDHVVTSWSLGLSMCTVDDGLPNIACVMWETNAWIYIYSSNTSCPLSYKLF